MGGKGGQRIKKPRRWPVGVGFSRHDHLWPDARTGFFELFDADIDP